MSAFSPVRGKSPEQPVVAKSKWERSSSSEREASPVAATYSKAESIKPKITSEVIHKAEVALISKPPRIQPPPSTTQLSSKVISLKSIKSRLGEQLKDPKDAIQRGADGRGHSHGHGKDDRKEPASEIQITIQNDKPKRKPILAPSPSPVRETLKSERVVKKKGTADKEDTGPAEAVSGRRQDTGETKISASASAAGRRERDDRRRDDRKRRSPENRNRRSRSRERELTRVERERVDRERELQREREREREIQRERELMRERDREFQRERERERERERRERSRSRERRERERARLREREEQLREERRKREELERELERQRR